MLRLQLHFLRQVVLSLLLHALEVAILGIEYHRCRDTSLQPGLPGVSEPSWPT